VLFILGTLGLIAFMVGVLLLVGHYYPGSSAELVDWTPTRSPEVEAQNEVDDIRQMMEAQNEIRRRRGVPEMTEEELQRTVAEDERLRLRGRGPFEDA
jgi:ABC-type lipoprotein release transport system permease subunit